MCSAFVNIGPRYRGPRCSRRASVRMDGNLYCGIHAKKEMRDKMNAFAEVVG
jgi:hypothetical protein